MEICVKKNLEKKKEGNDLATIFFSSFKSKDSEKGKINEMEKIRKTVESLAWLGRCEMKGGGGEKQGKLSRFSGSDEKNIKFGNDQSAFAMARWKRK